METLGFIFLGFMVCSALYSMAYYKTMLNIMEYKRDWWREQAIKLERNNKKVKT